MKTQTHRIMFEDGRQMMIKQVNQKNGNIKYQMVWDGDIKITQVQHYTGDGRTQIIVGAG